MPFKPVYGVPHGRMRAAQVGGGILIPECEEVLRDYYRFKEKDARAAFADSWVRITSKQLDVTWVVLYELLNIIKSDRLFENPKFMADGKARASFEEYWDQVVEKPFATWAELESTYHFATKNSPELLQKSLDEASKARIKALADAAEEAPLPTEEALNEARKEWASQGGKTGGRGRPKEESNGDSHNNNVMMAIQGNDSSYLSRRIARDFPEILARMKAGEFKSVRAAALVAGIVEPEFSCPLNPQKAARRILNRFQGDPLVELVRVLANHAGLTVSGPEETDSPVT